MDSSASPAKHAKTETSSPAKRTKPAAALALTREPALFRTVISFLPASEGDTEPSQTHAVLATIVSLCRAIPGLGRLVGPSNELFWRDMVLVHFAVANDRPGCMNLYNDFEDHLYTCQESMGAMDEQDVREDDPASQARWAAWCRHPAKAPIDTWNAEHPKEREPYRMLGENLSWWWRIGQRGVYFYGSRYGFLGDCQADEAQGQSSLWPAHEDAFSLFCDLALLQQFSTPRFDCLGTWTSRNSGDSRVCPCLLGRCDGEISGVGYKMLAFCGILPHFWYDVRPVSESWTGLAGGPPEMIIAGSENDAGDRWTEEEKSIFPFCKGSTEAKSSLRRLVYDHFSDWRRIHINGIEENASSPEFYIGKSKRSGRWLGVVDKSDYGYDHELSN